MRQRGARRRRDRTGPVRRRSTRRDGAAIHRGDETIAAARHRLDIARRIGGVAQRVAQPLHDCVQAVLEVDEGVGGPEPLPQLVAGHQLAGPLDQGQQHVQRLRGETVTAQMVVQLARDWVEQELADTDRRVRRPVAFVHGHQVFPTWSSGVCRPPRPPSYITPTVGWCNRKYACTGFCQILQSQMRCPRLTAAALVLVTLLPVTAAAAQRGAPRRAADVAVEDLQPLPAPPYPDRRLPSIETARRLEDKCDVLLAWVDRVNVEYAPPSPRGWATVPINRGVQLYRDEDFSQVFGRRFPETTPEWRKDVYDGVVAKCLELRKPSRFVGFSGQPSSEDVAQRLLAFRAVLEGPFTGRGELATNEAMRAQHQLRDQRRVLETDLSTMPNAPTPVAFHRLAKYHRQPDQGAARTLAERARLLREGDRDASGGDRVEGGGRLGDDAGGHDHRRRRAARSRDARFRAAARGSAGGGARRGGATARRAHRRDRDAVHRRAAGPDAFDD